jgi:hypothetical protein
VSTAWYALFGIRLVHGWSSKIEENGAASAAIVDWRLTRPGQGSQESQRSLPDGQTPNGLAGMCG